MGTVEDLAKEVKAAAEIIHTVSELLEDASRSVVIEVNNATSRTLRRLPAGHDEGHSHGSFKTLPKDTIGPFESDAFSSRSGEGAIATGTTGRVAYSLDDEGTELIIGWVVPFIGDNEKMMQVGGPHHDFYRCASIIGGGNKKAPARYVIGEEAFLGPRQSDWRTCLHCKSLFFGLDEGKCAATVSYAGAVTRPQGDISTHVTGDTGIVQRHSRPATAPVTGTGGEVAFYSKHEAAGYTFQLPYGKAGPNREGGWQKCGHCKMLFWNGSRNKGACPGNRAGHVAEADGLEFLLAFDMPARPSQQNDWRWCDKCYGLFFLPQNADDICPAGGAHHAHTYNYVLDHLG